MTETASNSRLVVLLTRIGMACLLVLPLSVLAIRLGLNFRIGLLVFALSGLLGMATVVALLLVSLLPRYRDYRLQALKGTLPALPPALLVLAILSTGGKYPPIHDITTDTEDPPIFDSGVYYRGDNANPIDIKPDVIEIQKQFYPQVRTIESDLSADDAFDRATNVAEHLGWEIYNSDPANGRIEASYKSFWFGFVDDIVIRVRLADGGSEIDLRSVSRVGRSDLGANAARIEKFAARF
jgi:uncharacterized protein (DUF1499 family)